MKTNPYKKDEDIEGYDGPKGEASEKTDVQKAFEEGNDTNVVTSYGNQPLGGENIGDFIDGNRQAKDGLDNTGTQGKDSLKDDAYPHKDGLKTKQDAESETGSSSNDFK